MKTKCFRTAPALLLTLACGACGSGEDTRVDGLLGQAPPVTMPAALTLTGSETVAPGVSTTGYVARYTPGTRGSANPGTAIELRTAGNANNSGNVVVVAPCGANAVEQPAGGGSTTDAEGRVCFNYTAPASITAPTTITLFATVPGQNDAANNPLMQTLTVMVQAATYRFVPPASTVIGLDPRNPTRLNFQWTQLSSTGSGTQGVAGQIQLSASGSGQFTLDGTPSGNPVIVETRGGSGMGDFVRAIGIYANASGAVNVNAVDRTNGRTATLNLQAQDTPTGIVVAASPRQIPPSGAQPSSSVITATVSGANGPMQNAAVSFTLSRIEEGSAERLSSQASTTSARGETSTEYFTGTRPGTARIDACIDETTFCASDTVTVVAP